MAAVSDISCYRGWSQNNNNNKIINKKNGTIMYASSKIFKTNIEAGLAAPSFDLFTNN
jgi:hypothetical protein